MKLLKITLILLLIVLVVLYGATFISQRLSGKDIGPEISCPEGMLEISVHDPEALLLADVTAFDKQDGDLTGKIGIEDHLPDDLAVFPAVEGHRLIAEAVVKGIHAPTPR